MCLYQVRGLQQQSQITGREDQALAPVRIATVLDRTIHPYKRRIWFWIADTSRAEDETQNQLHHS